MMMMMLTMMVVLVPVVMIMMLLLLMMMMMMMTMLLLIMMMMMMMMMMTTITMMITKVSRGMMIHQDRRDRCSTDKAATGFTYTTKLNPKRWRPSAKFDKKNCRQQRKVRPKGINYLLFSSKQAGRNAFLEIYQESQRKQIWTKENRCASPLLRYFCYVMLCSFPCCKNDIPANISDQQFISLNICTTCILYMLSYRFITSNISLCITPIKLIKSLLYYLSTFHEFSRTFYFSSLRFTFSTWLQLRNFLS